MKKNFLSMLLLWACLICGAIPASAWKDIKIDLTNGNLLTTDEVTNNTSVKFGVAIADDGTATRVEATDASAAIVLNGKYHSNEHGWGNFSATVDVDGPVKISMGTCQWGGDVKVTNTAGTQVATFNTNNGTCYHQNKTANFVSTIYKGDATTLTISGGAYTPYIAVEKINESDLKNDYKVTFSLGTVTADGIVPATETVEEGSEFTIPTNHTLYISGKTLTAWTDGTNKYNVGSKMTVTENVTLTPVFTDNTRTLADRTKDVTLLWDFQRNNGAPAVAFEGSSTGNGFYVTQATVGGENIDVKMDIDATKGKVNNCSYPGWCQWNQNTKFTIPSCKGAVVTLQAMSDFGADGKVATTVDGSSDYTVSKTLSYTVTSESESIDIIIGNDGGWYKSVQVVLPYVKPEGTPLLQTLTIGGTDILPAIEGKEYTYNVSSYDNLPQVGATANDKGEVEITQASADNGYKATVVLKNKATQETVATYTITFNKVNMISGKEFQWTSGDGSTTSLSDGTDYKYIRTSTVNPSFAIKGKSKVYSDNRFKTGMGTGNTWALVVPSNAIVEKVEFLNCQDAYYKYQGDETKGTTTKFNVASDGATVTTTDKDGNVLEYLADAQTITATLVNHKVGEPISFYAEGGSQLAFTGVKIYYSITDNGNLQLKSQSVSDGASVEINGNIALTFDNDIELVDGASVTINGNKVRTVVSDAQLTAYYWGLDYDSKNTVTLAANSVKDLFGNKYDKEISFTVNTGSKKTVEMKEYDYVVSNTSELDAAIEALKTSNKTETAERKTVFLKNGDYKYGTLDGDYQANLSLKIDNWNNIYNVSLIGESKDGVVISGTTKGITSATVNLGNGTGIYLQDLTIRNNYEFRTGSFTSVNVAMLGGNKAILKNVALQATQDTYVTGNRTYLEDCDIYGTVDFICGGGDNFFEHCNLILCDRGGDVIVAPNTDATKQWGYVFQNCTVKADEGATAVVDKGWNLGRPWQNEPRAYYLNTKMEVLPTDAGWTKMSNLPHTSTNTTPLTRTVKSST